MSSHQDTASWLVWLEKKFPILFTPHGVMSALIMMYVFKVILKGGVGGLLAGSLIMGADGIHNTSDIFEAGLVMLVVSLARGAGGEYPFGRRNLESLFVLAIGILLASIGISIFCTSGIGIAKTFFPNSIPATILAAVPSFLTPEVRTDAAILNGWYPVLASIVLVSIGLSFAASKIQIAVGKKQGNSSIVADGEETRSDGIIESVALIGISGEYFFQAPWIEYPVGLAAGILIISVAYELGKKGYSVLMQKSLGPQLEADICRMATSIHGVTAIEDLKTFSIGSAAIVMAKITTPCNAKMGAVIKRVIVEKIGCLLEARGFPEYGCYVRIAPPNKEARRVAYLITRVEGVTHVSASLDTTTHVRVSDMENGSPVRIKDYAIPIDRAALAMLLSEKQVSTLVIQSEERQPSRLLSIDLATTLAADTRELGITAR